MTHDKASFFDSHFNSVTFFHLCLASRMINSHECFTLFCECSLTLFLKHLAMLKLLEITIPGEAL